MDAFGQDFIVHNLPLIFLSGLDTRDRSHSDATPSLQSPLHEGGFRLKTDLPPLETPVADSLRTALLSHDGSAAPWRASPISSSSKLFNIKPVGRTFTLPPRKAPPPPHSPRLSAVDRSDGPPPPLVLHSPLSPLTPSSPLYPDGIVTPLWIAKHQTQLPSALISFYTLTTDLNTSSLLDNKVKNEINNIRAALASTNYKTRLVVVLLADGSIDDIELGDRLNNIRRATGLEKTVHFLPYGVSESEIATFATSLLSSLYQHCIEYYRDLSKHARRKRNRSTTPQPTIAPSNGHPLPLHGWHARYEFKLGVFAEFRQEMEAACRNYESAYENLFDTEMIDSIAAWSYRFNQARRLSDVIAVRILRCLLWTGQTTTAVRTWTTHRDRTRDLINRRGRGTENYGWEARQSNWAKTMADLLSRSDQSALKVKMPETEETISLFAGPEKSLPVGERVTPWENLSHQGYWLSLAQRHVQRRREFAHELSSEDRQPPQRSSDTSIKARISDTYLAPEPHEELPANGQGGFAYLGEIISLLGRAEGYYAERGQARLRVILLLTKARAYLQEEAWDDAAGILAPLWKDQLWRQAGWWNLLQYVGWALLDCAIKLQEGELIIRLKWELANRVFDPKPDTALDLHTALEGLSLSESRIEVALDVQEAAATVSSSFAFVSAEGHVGEPLECQFVLHSSAQPQSLPLKLAEAKIVFEGALKPIYLGASDIDVSDVETEFASVVLQETSRVPNADNKRSSAGAIASVSGESNLTLAPGQTRVFSLQLTPREAGEVSVASITLMIEEENFSLTVTNSESEPVYNHWWETKKGLLLRRDIGPSREVSKVQILPKLPKLEIQAKDFSQAYYTNEQIRLDLDIINNEDEAAIATVAARLISPTVEAARIDWFDGPSSGAADEDDHQSVPSKDLSTIQPGSSTTIALTISDTIAAVDHELEVTVTYNLTSDPESVLRKTLTLDIAVIRPFEANYDFTPKLNLDPWPSFFSAPTPTDSSPHGLAQHFLVTANLVSFATSPLTIEAILLTSTKVTGGAIASSTTGIIKDALSAPSNPSTAADQISTTISPEQSRTFGFSLSVQKLLLGDRDTVSLDLALEIAWRRSDSTHVQTTTLEVPRFIIPMAEPRVLVTAQKKKSIGGVKGAADATPQAPSFSSDVYLLKYVLENPSMHFLTFTVSMESSEDFGFSGPKSLSVSLVPYSKYDVQYRILPHLRGESGGVGSESGDATPNANANRKGIGTGDASGSGNGKAVRVQLNVVDAYFNQTLRVQPAVGMGGQEGDGVVEERMRLDKKGGVVLLID